MNTLINGFNKLSRWKKFLIGSVLIILAFFIYFSLKSQPMEKGNKYFWKSNHSFHFKTLATLDRVEGGAAMPNEILNIIQKIGHNDTEGWYKEWYEAAKKSENTAAGYSEPLNKAQAMKRAFSYYQNAEFYLHGDDSRRKETWEKQIQLFYKALELEGVRVDRLKVPYGEHKLRAIFFPGRDGFQGQKPLIMIMSGYDGTIEGTYFTGVIPLLARGYSVLLFEGPGQGEAIRKDGLAFIPEWEKPTSAVIDYFYEKYGKPRKLVFIGASFGALLGARATAFEKRIDGFVAFDAFYDMGAMAKSGVSNFQKMLKKWGMDSVIEYLYMKAYKKSVALRWKLHHSMWVLGLASPADIIEHLSQFTLKDVVDKVTADVLLLYSEADHYYAETDQLGFMQRGLINAKSVTTVIFKKGEAGEEHCRVGARALKNEAIVEWIEKKFITK